MQRAIWVLWPSFIVGGIAEGIFFTLFDPMDIHLFGETIELSRIHEDARDHMITLVARVLHERDVTGMQSAHGRNETDRP